MPLIGGQPYRFRFAAMAFESGGNAAVYLQDGKSADSGQGFPTIFRVDLGVPHASGVGLSREKCKLSPDGKRLAVVRTVGSTALDFVIEVYDLGQDLGGTGFFDEALDIQNSNAALEWSHTFSSDLTNNGFGLWDVHVNDAGEVWFLVEERVDISPPATAVRFHISLYHVTETGGQTLQKRHTGADSGSSLANLGREYGDGSIYLLQTILHAETGLLTGLREVSTDVFRVVVLDNDLNVLLSSAASVSGSTQRFNLGSSTAQRSAAHSVCVAHVYSGSTPQGITAFRVDDDGSNLAEFTYTNALSELDSKLQQSSTFSWVRAHYLSAAAGYYAHAKWDASNHGLREITDATVSSTFEDLETGATLAKEIRLLTEPEGTWGNSAETFSFALLNEQPGGGNGGGDPDPRPIVGRDLDLRWRLLRGPAEACACEPAEPDPAAFVAPVAPMECGEVLLEPVVFPFEPDWSEPVVERLAWATDVLTAYSGAEQRIALRRHPRHQLDYRALPLEARAAAALEALLYGRQAERFLVPWWPDQSGLEAPAGAGSFALELDTRFRRFRAGGQLLLWGDPFTWELHEILSLDDVSLVLVEPTVAAWPAGSLALPLIPGARLPDSQPLGRPTAASGRAPLRFEFEPQAGLHPPGEEAGP